MSMLLTTRRRVLASAGLSVLVCSAASAQVQPQQLETVVVTAARTEQRLRDALPSVTVIQRSEIEQRQASDLVELLARQAGIEFARAGGAGGQASLFVRGANSSQVLVLIDGVRLNTAVGGAAALGGITLDAVERIEIVRGNLSSLYGSEAIGGVVQIFTRGGARTGAAFDAEAGGGSTRAASGSATWAGDGTRLAATAGTRRSRPFSAIDTAQVVPGPFTPGANPDLDGTRNRSAALRASRSFGAAEVGASAWTSRNDTDFDSTADGPAATHVERSELTAWQAYLRGPLGDRWAARITVGESRDESRNTASDPFSFNNGEFRARNRQVAWQNDVAVAQAVTASLALEYLEQRGASTAYDPTFASVLTSFERRVASGWFGVNAAAGAQHVQVNVRHDDYSDSGHATTGLAAYGYALTPALRATLQVSSAFRAPSFNDLHFPFFGNPDLRPERARSIEAGLRYVLGDTSLRAAVYRTLTRDLVVFSTVTSRAENVARARAEGVELAAATIWRGIRLDANASFSRPVDADTGQRLLRRAPYVVNLGAYRDADAWTFGAEVGRVGARYDSDINTFARTTLAAYTLARATAAWRITPAMKLKLRVENLTDAGYETVDGYNTQRRAAFAGIEVRL
jgi:vitamin B12 transporter